LTIAAMIVFAGGLWFAYVQGTRHPAATGNSAEGVPLIRADDRPTKVKPDQPGGMAVPDQNVSLYNEKPGGAPVEKLLPTAEQPMPRPTAPQREAAAPPPIPGASAPSPAPDSAAAPGATPGATPGPTAASPERKSAAAPSKAAPKSAPSAKEANPVKEAAAILGAPATAAKAGGPVRVQLGSLRSAEAAREEWARLKRDQPELLGKLTAIAVKADLGDKGVYYRIQAGPLTDGAAADRLCGELRQRKLGCTLVR
jgi:hypothetical protein